MSLDSSNNPQDALEARITALLLGELPADEAATLQREIDQDPELAKLHQCLSRTIGLVREATASADEPMIARTPALKLSAERREKLLDGFKFVRPERLAAPTRAKTSRREWLALAAMVVALAILVSSIAMLSTTKRQRSSVVASSEFTHAEMLEEHRYANVSRTPQPPQGEATPASSSPSDWFGTVRETPAPVVLINARFKEKDADGFFADVLDYERNVPAKNALEDMPAILAKQHSTEAPQEVEFRQQAGAASSLTLAPEPQARIPASQPQSSTSGGDVVAGIIVSRERLGELGAQAKPGIPQSAARNSGDKMGRAGGGGGAGEPAPVPMVTGGGIAGGYAFTPAPQRPASGPQLDDKAGATRYLADGAAVGDKSDALGLELKGVSVTNIASFDENGVTLTYNSIRPNNNAAVSGFLSASDLITPESEKRPEGQTAGIFGATAVGQPDVSLGQRFYKTTDLDQRASQSAASSRPLNKAVRDLERAQNLDQDAAIRSASLADVYSKAGKAGDAGVINEINSPSAPIVAGRDMERTKSDGVTVYSVDAVGYSGGKAGKAESPVVINETMHHRPSGSSAGRGFGIVLPQTAAGAKEEAAEQKLELGRAGKPLAIDGRVNAPAQQPASIADLAGVPTEGQERLASRSERRMAIEIPKIPARVPRTLAEVDRAQQPPPVVDPATGLPLAQQDERLSRLDGKSEAALEELHKAENAIIANVRLAQEASRREVLSSEAVLGRAARSNRQEITLGDALTAYEDLSGRTVLRPSSLPDSKLRLSPETKLTRQGWMDTLGSVISQSGITMVPQGERFVKAVPQAQAGQEAAEFNQLPAEAFKDSSRYVTEVIQLKNKAPRDLVAKLQPLAKLPQSIMVNDSNGVLVLRDYEENVQKMRQLIEKIDVANEPPAEQRIEQEVPARKASTPAPIPQPEIYATDNPFSTFSLNVSDVSFKLAEASLQKGALPEPATIRSEEFINAFDYRDPEPTAGKPIAFAWDRARYTFAHNRDLLRFSVKTAATGRQAGRPVNLVLLLDNSGSMERADRVRIIQECLRVLATQLRPEDRVSVVAFARTPRLWVDGLSGSQAAEPAC